MNIEKYYLYMTKITNEQITGQVKLKQFNHFVNRGAHKLYNTRLVYLKPGGSGREQQPSVKMHVTA